MKTVRICSRDIFSGFWRGIIWIFLHLETTLREAIKYAETHKLPKIIKFMETPKREGLIRAKIFGAHKATGEVS